MKTCKATLYCRINRTELVPTGAAHPDYRCPVCGGTVDTAGKPGRTKPADRQNWIDQQAKKYGWTRVYP